MIVCPVCEHSQISGAECEVCGKRLAVPAAAVPVVAPVEGLEPTLHPSVDTPVERVADVEPTRHAPSRLAPELGADRVADLDSGRAAPVDVVAETTPDLERTASALPDGPTAVPSFVTCRYCRTPAMPGERLCSRCGMRLPDFGVGAGAGERSPGEVKLCTCGAQPMADGRCPSCGVRVH